MSKRGAGVQDPVDIFEDADLSLATKLLSGTAGGAARERAAPVPIESPPESETYIHTGDQAPNPETRGEGVRAPLPERGTPTPIEPTTSHLKLRVRQTTRSNFDAFKAQLSDSLGGVRLTDSNLGRAVMDWFLAERAQAVIEGVKSSPRFVRRPAADDAEGNALFDAVLVEILRESADD